LIFQGSYSVFPVQTLVGVVGTGLTAVYFVILLNRTCFGRLDTKTAYYPRVQFEDRLPALLLTALIIFLGIQPAWLVKWVESTSTAMIAAVPVAIEQRIAALPVALPVVLPVALPSITQPE
jgi:NAD(P)H-quinone oxidoreductase subunit 4